MRCLVISLVAIAAVRTGEAAPAADVVVVWAPGLSAAPIAAVAREAGAALIDRSPSIAATELPALIAQGIAAYDALKFDEAWTILDHAREIADRTGAEGVRATQLSDLFLYRGLVRTQQGEATAAWDELVTAMRIAPTRALDPARFPPRTVEELERARAAIGGTASLAVAAPPGCVSTIDGEPAPADGEARPLGPHWISTRCSDRAPWGTRVELAGPLAITARPVALAPPDDGELLVQARVVGARALIVIEVRAGVATVRLLGLDGRERGRRTMAIAASLEPAAEAMRVLLVPPVQAHWYESRWVWAAGAAVLAAAIIIPITAAIASDRAPASGTVMVNGLPKW